MDRVVQVLVLDLDGRFRPAFVPINEVRIDNPIHKSAIAAEQAQPFLIGNFHRTAVVDEICDTAVDEVRVRLPQPPVDFDILAADVVIRPRRLTAEHQRRRPEFLPAHIWIDPQLFPTPLFCHTVEFGVLHRQRIFRIAQARELDTVHVQHINGYMTLIEDLLQIAGGIDLPQHPVPVDQEKRVRPVIRRLHDPHSTAVRSRVAGSQPLPDLAISIERRTQILQVPLGEP